MRDEEIRTHIRSLIDEEHALRGASTETDPARLAAVESELDQCWDLLRQRQARREYGENPDDAEARPVRTVETYQQ
ncbi:hypothetical protein ABIA33_002121 [Streptacidiphilus sp. MAP12-16]|uniref:DUF2630 family protein n=1 Tax=Streptacidiphilus sp. MAP12-16 TaxID=3156300 RepID=UPI0035193494